MSVDLLPLSSIGRHIDGIGNLFASVKAFAERGETKNMLGTLRHLEIDAAILCKAVRMYRSDVSGANLSELVFPNELFSAPSCPNCEVGHMTVNADGCLWCDSCESGAIKKGGAA